MEVRVFSAAPLPHLQGVENAGKASVIGVHSPTSIPTFLACRVRTTAHVLCAYRSFSSLLKHVVLPRVSGARRPKSIAFRPLPPKKAIQRVEEAGVIDAASMIRDYAGAGIVTSYAMVVETIGADGGRSCVRDAAIPVALWHRMIDEGADEGIWTGATVRLAGVDATAVPKVNITGVRFNEGDLYKLVALLGDGALSSPDFRIPSAGEALAPLRVPDARTEDTPAVVETPIPRKTRERRQPDPSILMPGKLLLTVAETQAALGLGRTKVNELMNDGRLVRQHIDGGVRIEVASVKALAGLTE